MSTTIAPIRPPKVAPRTRHSRSPSRIVERTTTVTREIFLDDSRSTGDLDICDTPGMTDHTTTEAATADLLRGIDRATVRLGAWLIELGRGHSMRRRDHRGRDSAEIAQRLDRAKEHDLRRVNGLPY